MKPTLKPPGTKRLKPNCDVPLSNFAFKFNFRRSTMFAEYDTNSDGIVDMEAE